jgi:hypothetical protein
MTGDVLMAGPVEGWRAWRLALDRQGLTLMPIGRGNPWPRLDPASARCWKRRRHRAPESGCTCGLYAVNDAALLSRARSPAAIGTVALWGAVIQHTLGWRAEFAYPQRLALVCHVCLFQRGVARSRADLVTEHPDGRLVPLCARHLRVTRACERNPFDVISAGEIQAELLGGYAVEQLAW